MKLGSALELNNAVLSAHLFLIFVFTIISIIHFNVKATNGSTGSNNILSSRWESVWTFVGGIADLYISCTLWIVTDPEQTPIAFSQGNRSTVVLDIVRPNSSVINSEVDDSQFVQQESYRNSTGFNDSTVGDKLIAQFFREIKEGPDRDWLESIYEDEEIS